MRETGGHDRLDLPDGSQREGAPPSPAPLSPHHLPPLTGAGTAPPSIPLSGVRDNRVHTHRLSSSSTPTTAIAPAEPTDDADDDDDALHWQRSLHSEVMGSPRILLASPTHRHHGVRDSFLSFPQAELSGRASSSAGTPLTQQRSVADPVSAVQGSPSLPQSPRGPTHACYGATDTRTTPLLLAASSTPQTGGEAGGSSSMDARGPASAAATRQEHEAHRRQMHKRLLNEDFFSSPIRKWRRDGRFPFKLLTNILMVLCLLIQLSLYHLPEAIASEQQRQAILHHFTESDAYLSSADGDFVRHPTLLLEEQVQVFQSIENFVDVYYSLANTSVSELNYYYWQREATDRDKLLRAYHNLGLQAGESWANGEEVLHLLQEYQRRKRVKAFVRANQPTPTPDPTVVGTGSETTNSSFTPTTAVAAAPLNLSAVQPVVMQVLAYPYSLRERWAPSQATPRWFTFLLDAANPLGPFRHYNRTHTGFRRPPAPTSAATADGTAVRRGHKQFQRGPNAAWDTTALSDADLLVHNTTPVWRGRTDNASSTRRPKKSKAFSADYLQLACHARLDVMTGRYYSPCRTPVQEGSATGESVSSDLLFSFMDNVVAVRLFASVRHLSMPERTTQEYTLLRAASVAKRHATPFSSSDLTNSTLQRKWRLGTRHYPRSPATPFNRSVYRWMMEKNLRVHRGGMVEAELVVRTSVVRLQPTYRHPAVINTVALAGLAALEIYLRRRALGRIHRYRRRVALEKQRLRRRAAVAGEEEEQATRSPLGTQYHPHLVAPEHTMAARRVQQGTTPLMSPRPAHAPPYSPLTSSSSSSSPGTDHLLGSSSDDDTHDRDDGGRGRAPLPGQGWLHRARAEEEEEEPSMSWGAWWRRVWWELRLGIHEELGLSLDQFVAAEHATPTLADGSVDGVVERRSPTARPDVPPPSSTTPTLLPAGSTATESAPLLQSARRRHSAFAWSRSSSRWATPSSSARRALVARRREEARQDRLLARRYVSLRDSWRYQLQQSMGSGWHYLAIGSACLCLWYAVLYLSQFVPVVTSFRADVWRSLALGLACLSSSLVFLSYARYFPRVYFPILVTKVVVPRLLVFVLSIAPLFLGFSLFFHTVFGAHSDGRFSSLGRSVMTLCFMTYGDSLLPAINTSERGASRVVAVLANVMTVVYVLLFMMTILNFALGITIHEWHRIRQRFGTVLNMSSILFSVRTREEVRAEALEKARTSLELLLFMTYEDEAAAAAARAREGQPTEAVAAAGSEPSSEGDRRSSPLSSADARPSSPQSSFVDVPPSHGHRPHSSRRHSRLPPSAFLNVDTQDRLHAAGMANLALPPSAAAVPRNDSPSPTDLSRQLALDTSDAATGIITVNTPGAPGLLTSVTSSDANESVQLSAATTMTNLPSDQYSPEGLRTPRGEHAPHEGSTPASYSDEGL